jgi:hypothetical protein
MRTFPWRLAFQFVALAALTVFLASCQTPRPVGVRAATEPTAIAPLEATPSPLAATPTIAPAYLSDVIVTGSAAGAPDGCTVETVAGQLLELADGVNNANPTVVPEFFGASEATFEWYCMQSFTAYSLDELEAYFQQRYGQHERWRLESVQVNGWDQARRLLHFGPVVISRTAKRAAWLSRSRISLPGFG